MEQMHSVRPKLKLTGTNGNAFAILAVARAAAKKAGWNAAEIKAFTDEATSGDYDHLLATVCASFDVK